MKTLHNLRAIALTASAAIAMFGPVSLAAPGHAFAGYWATVCRPWGCRQVYVTTCHRVFIGYTAWGRPIFQRACG